MFYKVTINLAGGGVEIFFVDDLTLSYGSDGSMQSLNFRKPRRHLEDHFFQRIHLQLHAIQSLVAEPVDETGEIVRAADVELEPEPEPNPEPKTSPKPTKKPAKTRRKKRRT